MNLIFSYGSKLDIALVEEYGLEFLGAGKDYQGKEVHVFRIMDTETYDKINNFKLTSRLSELILQDLNKE